MLSLEVKTMTTLPGTGSPEMTFNVSDVPNFAAYDRFDYKLFIPAAVRPFTDLTITSGSLPVWAFINVAAGSIYGMSIVWDRGISTTFTVQATDARGQVASQTFTWTVQPVSATQ